MDSEKEFLKNYDMNKYERPSAAADIAVFTVRNIPSDSYRKLDRKSLCLLLVKRGAPPFKDYYALPGGFAKKGETLDETARRELKEETAVDNIYLSQLKTTSTPLRDPRGWIISCGYIALADSGEFNIQGGDDAAEAKWFEVSYELKNSTVCENEKRSEYSLSLTDGEDVLTADITERISFGKCGREHIISAANVKGIAFDHAEIIAYAITELRRRTAYEKAEFCLLPEKFTMADLQAVYETIMGVKETQANFRRKMKDYVIQTDEISGGGGHRPSKFFVRNYEAFL